ncbi:MAG: hypothetical protein ACFFBP_11810 [Promethearchaeota archaeon]
MAMFNEEEYFYEFIENDINKLNKQNEKDLQKKKFQLISKLIENLYQHKNSREHFNLISNQLILLLTLSHQKKPFDIFFEEEEDYIKNASDIFGDILRSELAGKK